MPLGDQVSSFLQELSTTPIHPEEEIPLLVFDFCMVKKGKEGHRIQHQIRPIHFQQRSPEVLFFCEVQILEHFPPSFSHAIKLMHKNIVLKQSVFSPPVTDHPILKDLSATERRVLKQIYQNTSGKDLHSILNMAPDILKSHKSHILRKTGFLSVHALVTFLK